MYTNLTSTVRAAHSALRIGNTPRCALGTAWMLVLGTLRRLSTLNYPLSTLLLALMLCASRSYAQSAAWVTTDQADYPPGSTVYITGAGFAPGEAVTCQVLHSPTGGDDATSPAHQPWTTTADDAGNISTTWGVPLDEDELNATLQLTATGQASGLVAQTIFTDAGSFTFSPTAATLNFTTGGGTQNFSQDVTAQKNNGTFSTHLALVGTGGNPVPAAWVSFSPGSASPQTFVTGGSGGSSDTKTWTVIVTVPSGSSQGTFTGNLTNVVDSGTPPGAGTLPTLTVTVTGTATTTTLSSSANPSTYGASVTFTANVSGSGGPPTGTVTFKDGATTLGTGTLSSGVATFSTSALTVTPSAHSITAVYGGDSTFSTSTSSAVSQVVNKATLTVTPNAVSTTYSGTALVNSTYSDA